MVVPDSMMMAAFTGNTVEVTAFLENNPESVDDFGEGDGGADRTMLQIATLASLVRPERSLEMIRLLISRGADVNRRGGPGTSPTALHEMCIAAWRECVEVSGGIDLRV